MSEAIILEVIKELEDDEALHIWLRRKKAYKRIVKEVINELRMMLDFLRDKESGERRRLNHLLADFAGVAQVSTGLVQRYFSLEEMDNALDWMRRIKRQMVGFGVGEGVSRPQTQSVGDEVVVVGLEKDVQQLIGRVILNEYSIMRTRMTNSSLVISSIKGMLGTGKTTLARQVYNHPAVIEKFKRRRAWVSISSYTTIHEVLVELVQQLVELDGDSLLLEEMDNRSLGNMLYQNLEGMPYFVVVDNMLPQMRFDSILECLPHEGQGRLLLTSRYEIISNDLVNPQDIYYTHEMKALDSDKSWQLFLKTIFRGDQVTSDEHIFPKHLEMKGKEMLKKCWGLPIAIIDVGRQKAKQRLSGIEWEELFNSFDLGEILKLLEPMYHNLDEKLKPYFLHMSFFKENAIMREEKLEQIWDASGLETRRNITYTLSSQSIVEVVNLYPEKSKVKRCRMNPLLHKLSIKKAEEEMGLEILRSSGNNQSSWSPRHRVISCGRDKFNHSMNQDKHLVSLIFHGGGRYLDAASQSYWKSFELLKILDMEDFGVKTLSETIGTLTELRYLGLRNNYIQEIPHSLEGLKKLEVLDIALNFMVEMSDIIMKMDGLRHLYMSDVIYRKPLKVDALENLETLTYISVYDWAYEVSSLKNMNRLQKLGIEDIDENLDVGKLSESVPKMESLDHLILRGFRFKSMPSLNEFRDLHKISRVKLDGRLSSLPWKSSLFYITNLVLINTCLDDDPMAELQSLGLKRLKLQNAYTGREMEIEFGSYQFSRLEVLCISELWNLRNLRIEGGAKSKLEQLEIMNCPHLEAIPEEIGSMDDLRKFQMVTTKHIATKIRNSHLISKIAEADITP